ncbi:hypothetical protein E1301_Tti020474 [Triplophysa tibetana]|uniref:Uncharacterized protein n=1 Tax=Triplophysa tibetana TaxID=1572043 RepID=A0A5A9NEB5_9TELE|nr:hypothetical protein E1301_Tti020474 [Triplophysa tibetana]
MTVQSFEERLMDLTKCTKESNGKARTGNITEQYKNAHIGSLGADCDGAVVLLTAV